MCFLNKFLIIAIAFLFLACNNKLNNSSKQSLTTQDSISYYYLISKSKNNSLFKRYNAINKSLVFCKEYNNDSLYLKTLYQKNIIHLSLKQYDSLHYFNGVLFKCSLKINNYKYLGKYHYLKAYYFNTIINNSDSAFYYYNKSKYFFQKIKDSSQIGRKLMSMAQIQQNQSDFIGSKETITEALQFLQTNKNIKYIASSFSVLATNHQRLLNYNDAIHYYKKAIITTKSKNDKIIYQNNLATVYIDNKQYLDAITLLNTLEQDSLLKKQYIQYARIIDNLGYAKWLHQEKNVLPTLLKALNLRIQHNDKRGQIASYLHLGEYYLGLNKQLSKQHLNKVILTSKQIKNPKGEIEALQFLMKLNPNNITIKDRYISLNDSLYKQELKAKTQFAKYKYDDKVKQEIITNLTLNKKLDTLEISKQKSQKIIFILLGLITVILGFIILYFLKQKHTKEKLKEVYNTETRISQKVHDELANDVYSVMNRIQNNDEIKQNDVLNQLENIYKKTRDISYENSAINLEDKYYTAELKDMLQAYQNETTNILTVGLSQDIFKNIANHKKINIERILKELMTNMKKHSKASNVVINFKKDKRNVYITYVDNGIGLKNTTHFKRNGLQNAENRIKTINGIFNFDTTKANGVSINMSVPV